MRGLVNPDFWEIMKAGGRFFRFRLATSLILWYTARITTRKEERMKSRTRRILNHLLILVPLVVVLLISFSGEDFAQSLQSLRSMSPRWIALCLLVYAAWVVCDAVAVWFFLRRQGYHIGLRYALFVSIAGTYYSNITPGATGGQPMQVYYLKKRNVPVGIGTSAVTVKFFCFQFMLSVICTVLWAMNIGFVREATGGNRWILITGYVYNLVSVGLVLLVAVNMRLVRFLMNLVIRIGTRLRLIKHPDIIRVKWEDVLATFHDSVMMMRRRPLDFVVQLLIGGLQLIIHMLVIVCVYKAFGLSGVTAPQLVTLGVCLYISAAYTPLPGASGAQEGVFALYFSSVFPVDVRPMALLLWRFFTYYISLIVGGVVTVGKGFLGGRKDKAPEPQSGDAAPADGHPDTTTEETDNSKDNG